MKSFCDCEEFKKPVRRDEKKILNEMMSSIRFPQKIRVQEPCLKSYVLLQAAISRIDIKDFSMRVEQSEIVECALRILSALIELCKERYYGKLLETSILVDRSLRCRIWDVNYPSVFFQCAGSKYK